MSRLLHVCVAIWRKIPHAKILSARSCSRVPGLLLLPHKSKITALFEHINFLLLRRKMRLANTSVTRRLMTLRDRSIVRSCSPQSTWKTNATAVKRGCGTNLCAARDFLQRFFVCGPNTAWPLRFYILNQQKASQRLKRECATLLLNYACFFCVFDIPRLQWESPRACAHVCWQQNAERFSLFW